MSQFMRGLLAAAALTGLGGTTLGGEKFERLPPLQPAVIRSARQEPIPAREPETITPHSPLPTPSSVHELLTLESLQGMAVANNPALAQAAGRVTAAQGKYIQSGLPLNPNLGYTGQQLGSPTTVQHGVLVSQEFIRGKKLSLQQQAACHEWEMARQLHEAQRGRVLTDTRNAYYEILVAQELIQLNQRLIEISNQSLEFAQRKFEAKEGTKIDTLQAKIESDQVRLALQRSQFRAAAAWRRLVAVVSVPLVMQPVAGQLSATGLQLTWDEAWQRVATESPELAAASSDIQRARWHLHRQRAEPIPNLTVQAIMQHDQDIGGWDGAIQATFPLPIRNMYQGSILQADGELHAAEHNLDRLRHQLQQRLADAFQRYQDAKAEVESYSQEIIPAAQESLQLTSAGYRAGEFPFDHVLMAQRTLFTAKVNQVEAIGKLQASFAEIDGLLLTGSLGGP